LASVFAQDPGDSNPGKEDSAREKSIREQDIYIPYDKLRQVFEKHGRGVFLPYDKFQELWKAAQDKNPPTTTVKPPVGWVITEIENNSTVEKDVVRVAAKVKIELLAEGWQEIPLRLADSAIISAKIGGQPARIRGETGKDYSLLIEKQGKQPEQVELNLEYAKAITRTPGQNSVSFESPQSPVSRWKVTIPQAGVNVNLHPLIAATEVPSSEGNPAENSADAKKKEETVVLAFVGAAATVRIDWTPKAEGATGLTALAGVQTTQQLWIKEGVVRCMTTLDYAISRSELKQLSLEAPADYKVVNVFDSNMRGWKVEAAEGKQKIVVDLFEPAKLTQKLVVELEKITDENARQTVQAPIVKAVEASRQQGIVVVQIAEGLRGETAKTSGLLQIDSAEVPPELGKNRAFSYRYATVPYELAFSLEKISPRISAVSLVHADLEPESLSVEMLTVLNIERSGVFKLEFELPQGYDVQSVKGIALGDARAVGVDNHRVEGENKTHLVVNLASKALGKVGLIVNLRKELHLPELLAPTAKAAEIVFTVPQVAANMAERATGSLEVFAPESLRVNPDKVAGLRTIPHAEASKEIALPPSLGKDSSRLPVLAYAFTQDPASLVLKAERRKPYVTVHQLLTVRVEDGVAKYKAKFSYDVQYSGVKSLRIDIPEDVAKIAHTQTAHDVIAPPPADLRKGDLAWRLTNDAELLGKGAIELEWETKLDKMDVGKEGVPFAVWKLKPAEVDRAWGEIVLAAAENIDLSVGKEIKSLQPIDPRLDVSEKVEGAARAFSFHDDWELPIVATRYDLADVKQTNIERGLVRMVITQANEISVQAIYRIRTARDRLAIGLPEGARFHAEPKLDGRAVMLEKQKKDEYFIPIVAPNAEKPFLLELRYSLPGNAQNRLDIPSFQKDTAAQKVYLEFYVPEKKTLLNVVGPWTKEYWWRLLPTMMWRPNSNLNDNQLLSWVREGIQISGSEGNDFPTDGTVFLYSTVQPDAPPNGSLNLTLLDARWLQALVFLVVVLGGIALVRVRCRFKTLAVGSLFAVLILLGVFYPIFAMQTMNGILILAFVIVLIVWSVAWMFGSGKRPEAASAPVPDNTVPPTRDSGVDLSHYEPLASDSSASTEPKKAGGNGEEGGKSHE
jgi:hypothetical protein